MKHMHATQVSTLDGRPLSRPVATDGEDDGESVGGDDGGGCLFDDDFDEQLESGASAGPRVPFIIMIRTEDEMNRNIVESQPLPCFLS
jgi:uncharacterized protein (DUF1786 family)